MAPNTSTEPRLLDRFTQATTAYIVPCLLLVTNMWDRYDSAEFNILAGVYLLAASLYRYESLGDSEAEKSESKKRKSWNISRRLFAAGGACIVVFLGLRPIFNAVAYACVDIFFDDHVHNPTNFEGRAGLNDEIRYQFQALSSNRAVPSEMTVWMAVDREAKKAPKSKLSCTQCLKLAETFNGYLKVGPVNNFDEELYCGPTLSFNQHCDAKNEGDL
ncbi:hypothetical protein ACHAPU_010523 [Fusarium lateritium]